MKSLTKNIWRSSITDSVNIQLYNTHVLPVLLYGSEIWKVTVKSGKQLHAFDQCCLQHILQISFTTHVTNQEVRICSTEPPDTHTITAKGVRLFGHSLHSDSDEDQTRALNADIDASLKDWTLSRNHAQQTSVHTVDNNLKQQNLGLWSD